MVQPVSFSGTYKVNNQNKEAFSKFHSYSLDKELEEGVKTQFKDKFIKKDFWGNFDYKAEQTLIVPDNMDMDVEKFCANNGISYTKYDTKDLLNPKTISSRIDSAPRGYKKVDVDVKKLEGLLQTQQSNIEHCENDYDKYYQDKVDTMLKTGDKIPASTLRINSNSGNEDLKDYVNRYGVENLNDNQVIIDFTQETSNPDHGVYFALRNMGLDKVPVYVDKQTYEAGTILGLF